MTRVYTKLPRSTSNSASTAAPTNNNMSAEQPQSSAAPSTIPVHTLRVTDSSSKEAVSSRRDVATATSVEDTAAEPAAPKPSQAPINIDKADDKESPVVDNNGLKAPSLAHKARLRVHFEDLTHPAVAKFLTVMPLSTLLQNAISHVQQQLFTPSDKHHTPPHPPQTTSNPNYPATTFFNTNTATSLAFRPPPPLPPQRPIQPPTPWTPQEVRSVTLIIRSMDGVAYTTGTDLDPSHKEIHLNIGYLDATMRSNASKPNGDALFRYEILGVITHEMVHAFQHNAHSTCPGGLIEGIADYVRLKSDLGAKHWDPWPANKDSRGEKWDEGYQKTAWFLTWVEEDTGRDDVIGKLNFEMRRRKWEDGKVWKDVIGEKVEDMWGRYKGCWDDMNKKHKKEKDEETPTATEVEG